MGLSWAVSNCSSSYLQASPQIWGLQAHTKGEKGYKRESWQGHPKLNITATLQKHMPTAFPGHFCVCLVVQCLLMGSITEVFKLSTETPVTLILPFLWARVQQQKPLHERVRKNARTQNVSWSMPYFLSTEGQLCLCLLPDLSFNLKPAVPRTSETWAKGTLNQETISPNVSQCRASGWNLKAQNMKF